MRKRVDGVSTEIGNAAASRIQEEDKVDHIEACFSEREFKEIRVMKLPSPESHLQEDAEAVNCEQRDQRQQDDPQHKAGFFESIWKPNDSTANYRVADVDPDIEDCRQERREE